VKPVAVVPELREVPIEQVDIPGRPARRFLGDIPALADSMREYGLQQPISVRVQGDRFILTSGLRRLTAARMLQWTMIPAFVRRIDEDHAYLLDLIENLQREDLSPEEEADALRELIRTRGWTLQQLADALKRSVGYISKRVRVFDDPLLRAAVVERGLPVSTAEELLAADTVDRPQLVERALSERWDQTRARQEIQARALADVSAAIEAQLAQPDASTPRRRQHESMPVGRPRGLTRAIREFHRLIARVEPTQLTEADRAVLRSLFRDLTMLARAPATPRAVVFPPLPTAGEHRRARAGRSSG
jgi:ParB family chromosome partitioning protein